MIPSRGALATPDGSGKYAMIHKAMDADGNADTDAKANGCRALENEIEIGQDPASNKTGRTRGTRDNHRRDIVALKY